MAKPVTEIDWQLPKIVDGKGVISPPSATEPKPCYLCKSFDKDTRKLIEYVVAHGMTLGDDGCYTFRAIAGDLPGRHQYKIDPRKTGFCRSLCTLALDEATCDNWKQRATRADMAGLVRK
jgi:hypothetical protein